MSKDKGTIFAHPVRTLDESEIKLVSGGKGNLAQDAHAKAMCAQEAAQFGGGG